MRELILDCVPLCAASLVAGFYLGFQVKWDTWYGVSNYAWGRWFQIPLLFGLVLGTLFLVGSLMWHNFSSRSVMEATDRSSTLTVILTLSMFLVMAVGELGGWKCCIFVRRRLFHH